MDKGDYMTDFLLHGLISLLGKYQLKSALCCSLYIPPFYLSSCYIGPRHVTDFPARDALYKTVKDFNHSTYLESRSKLYGAGFSWGMKLNTLSTSNDRDGNTIKQAIIQHKYDIVILGSGHRDGWAAKLHYWDIICKHYHPLEVGFIDGADYHLRKRTLDKYSACAGHLFSREGFVVGHENK
jgi:hypothetical protein